VVVRRKGDSWRRALGGAQSIPLGPRAGFAIFATSGHTRCEQVRVCACLARGPSALQTRGAVDGSGMELADATDDNCGRCAQVPTLEATAHTPKGLKVPCSAAELPARAGKSRVSVR
jgi:hypothetical protein